VVENKGYDEFLPEDKKLQEDVWNLIFDIMKLFDKKKHAQYCQILYDLLVKIFLKYGSGYRAGYEKVFAIRGRKDKMHSFLFRLDACINKKKIQKNC
jgi:hypothetical protein